jgi:hypothetical protein
MAEIVKDRICAEVEGDVTVFLIGMRVNKPWKVWRWLPIFFEMPKMLKELGQKPEIGLLHSRGLYGFPNMAILQYWKSATLLQAYAHAPDHAHLGAWRRFNDRIGTSGDVGIWHETYVVPKGQYESIFVNMPRYGLGLAGAIFPAKGQRASASKRLGLKPSRPAAPETMEPDAPVATSSPSEA